MAALDAVDNHEYDEFDDSQLEATEKVAPEAAAAPETKAETPDVAPETKAETEKPADEEQDDDRSHLIPRHRYNFQRDQRIAAERQLQEMQQRMAQYEQYLAQLQQQQPQQQKVDYDAKIDELDQQIEDARADGDMTKARQLRAQQRNFERQAVMEQMQASMPRQQQIDPRQLAQQAAESTRLEGLVTQLEKQYPMLDETHDTFDAEVSEEVMTLYENLSAKMPASQAMERAVLYVTRAHAINPTGAKPTRGNVERNIKAAAAQPPELDGVGMDSAKAGITRTVDVAKMSQDQFEALDDAEIEKLLAAA